MMKDAAARLLAAVALLAGFAFVGRMPTPASGATAARVCDADDDTDDATLMNCLALQPRSVELLVVLGTRYEGRGRWPEAEAAYRRAIAVDEHDADVWLRLGRVLMRRGDGEGARIASARVAALRPGGVPEEVGNPPVPPSATAP